MDRMVYLRPAGGLMMRKPGSLVPSLATSWEWIDDTHVRFFLRDDAVAYDGTTITANDVLFSVQRGLEGGCHCPMEYGGRQ